MLPIPRTRSIVYSDDPKGAAVDVFDPVCLGKNAMGSMASHDADDTMKILLPNAKSKEEIKTIALDHLSNCLKRAKDFIAAMGVNETQPNNVRLDLFLGYGIQTTKCAFINRWNGDIDKVTYDLGMVAISAFYGMNTEEDWSYFLNSPIPWDRVTILRAAHMGITKDPTFTDNVLFTMTSERTLKEKSGSSRDADVLKN